MKQTLLASIFLLFSALLWGQSSPDGGTLGTPQPIKVSVFPNPATDFISINKDENIKQITVFSLVGKKLKTFEEVEKNERYDVSDLPNGMYLVQVIDNTNKIVTTQRISKR